MTARAFLARTYPPALVDALLVAYGEIEDGYITQKWKLSELDAGHFVEAVRRLLEHVLFGNATPLGANLPRFNEGVLSRYANASAAADESYRLLIPRVLWSISTVRNKRGVGHAGTVSANEMDATLLLYGAKWTVAELVRLSAGVSTAEAQALISNIVERQLDLIWKHDAGALILDEKMAVRDQVLVYLYDRDSQTVDALRSATRYKNPTNFRKLIARLHDARLVLAQPGGVCRITPKGRLEAETIIRRAGVIQ